MLLVPSKTFLLGEYGVLQGGPALVVNTEPKFKMEIHRANQVSCTQDIATFSPAGQLIDRHPEFFEKYDMEFLDPHKGKGGFGASTAQFLTAYCVYARGAGIQVERTPEYIADMLELYRAHAKRNSVVCPSGADLVAQFVGHVTLFDEEKGEFFPSAWPFRELSFLLVRTGHKISTHEHLDSLEGRDFSHLKEIARAGSQQYLARHQEGFVHAVAAFNQELHKQNLVAGTSKELLDQLTGKEILAAKGCGAMGADVLALFCHVSEKDKVLSKLEGMGLEVVATEAEISSGLSGDWV